MLSDYTRRGARCAASAAAFTTLAACTTTTPPPPAAVLAYTPADCTSSVSLTDVVAMETDEKTVKRATRNRTVELSAELDEDSDCLTGAAGAQPYEVFALPALPLDGAIVYAGAELGTLRTVMPEILTLDDQGNIVRRFDANTFRRYTNRFGHSFKAQDDEAFVVIAADPSVVGNSKATVETSTASRYVTHSYGTSVGTGVDTVGIQNEYDRIYSFAGKVGIRVVYPKAK